MRLILRQYFGILRFVAVFFGAVLLPVPIVVWLTQGMPLGFHWAEAISTVAISYAKLIGILAVVIPLILGLLMWVTRRPNGYPGREDDDEDEDEDGEPVD